MSEAFIAEKKKLEWYSYNAHVSSWESERYLRFF